jgi:hypothetical protein
MKDIQHRGFNENTRLMKYPIIAPVKSKFILATMSYDK